MKKSDSNDNIVKIPRNYEIPQIPHPAVARRVEKITVPSLPKSSSTSAGPNQTMWKSMHDNLKSNDDFFCLPQQQNEEKPKRPKRKSSIGVLPKPQELYTRDVDFANPDDEIDPLIVSNLFEYALDPLETSELADKISSYLQNTMTAYLISLQDCINRTQKLIDSIKVESSKVAGTLSLNVGDNRIVAILPLLKIRYQIKQSQKISHVFQGNIRRIAQVVDYIAIGKMVITKFDSDRFGKKYILNPAQGSKYDNLIAGLAKKIELMKPVEDKSWQRFFEDPNTKFGQIIKRFQEHLAEMDYNDVEIIIDAIATKKHMISQIRTYLFDIAWTNLMFPFSDTQMLHFPPIFHKTPKDFNAPFIPEPYLSTEIRLLNSTEWPFKMISEDMFLILIETDPFTIADFFWESIQRVGRVVKKLNPNVEELDFDQLFSLLIVIISAFGVDEILESMSFSASFEDFENDSVHRKFAMQHMTGIVSYILSLKDK